MYLGSAQYFPLCAKDAADIAEPAFDRHAATEHAFYFQDRPFDSLSSGIPYQDSTRRSWRCYAPAYGIQCQQP